MAHRGASDKAPQNTMAAFEKAIEMGADFIELDVHLTKDDEIVVIHDKTVDSTTDGSGKVSEMTLEEIKQLDAGSYFDENFKGEQIPKLEEVLDLAKGEIGLNIELKTRRGKNKGIENKVLNLIEEKNFDEELMFSSFSFESMEKIKELDEDKKVGLIYITLPITAWHATRNHKKNHWADAANLWHWTVGKRHLRKLQDLGVEVNVWTPDGEKKIKKMAKAGVDGIITNKPGFAKEVIDQELE